MPDRDVETIRDLIYYQYAKIMERRAFGVANGKEAKRQHYGFIKKTFRELKCGVKRGRRITRVCTPARRTHASPRLRKENGTKYK